jgi:hypothetical protein
MRLHGRLCVPVIRRFITIYLLNSFYHVIVASSNCLLNENNFSVKKLYFKPHPLSFYRKQINSPISHICFVCKNVNLMVSNLSFFSFFNCIIGIWWLSDSELMGVKFLKVHFNLIHIFGFKHIALLVTSLILV